MSSSSFCVSKLEAALGTSLPVDGNGTSVIKGTRRETPYGTLFNVSVHSVDKKGFVTTRYGIPDDDTYLQYPSLFASIPRILVVRVNDDETGSYAVVASGQPKFMAVTDTDNDDGDDGDDDDDENDNDGEDADADNTGGAFRIPGVVSYYADEKANGHLIFYRLIPGTRLLLAGTKNYAWLASLDDSLQTIEASSPTAMTLDAYAYMFDMLKRDCTFGNVMRVLQTGVTLLGERETNQHLRYYADPGVMFFDASLPPPFKTPHSVGPFAVKDMTNEKLLQLRSGGNSEGWVLRGVNAHGETLVRLKLKTAWYVILRGGRQLFNPADGFDVTLTKWRARMHVQNAFLHIDASYLNTVVFDGYIVPLTKYMYDRGVKKTDICYSGVGFAPVLEAFRRETGINDDFTNLPTMTNITRVSCRDKRGGGTLFMTACMPPGVGKTTLMMDLAARLGGTHLSQDQFATNRGAFYACLKTRLRAHDAVFLHRCCFSRNDRASVFTAVRETKSRVFILEAENDAALLYTALRGVVLRGENHETMGKLSDAKRCFIAANFYTKHERVDVATECLGIETALVHNFNMLRCVDLPPHVHDALKGVLDIVGSCDGFNTDDTALTDSQVVVITTLVEAVKTGPELRHSPSTLATNAELVCKSFLSSDLGACVASVSPARVRFVAILLTPESKKKLTRMLSAHIALPAENVIHTGDHVTVAYQPSSSIMTLLTPHFNTANLSMVTKYIKRHKSGGIAATRVVLCDDVHADIRAGMSPHRMAHVTAFYNPATYKAADANRLFIDDDWVTETESFDLTITLQGTRTCVYE
jgi:hypothetical protein